MCCGINPDCKLIAYTWHALQIKLERQAAALYLFCYAGDIKRLLRMVVYAGGVVPLIA
jgi:hypothetical protein